MARVGRLVIGALLLATVAAYANAFAGAFLFDDRAVILDDARLASPAAFFSHVTETIRPLTKFTLLVDRQLYGSQPAGYHLLNLLLHLASGALAWAIVRRLGANDGLALWTAALFLLHPIATETVTYISGRPTGLMACLYLSAFLLFLVAREAHGDRRRRVVAATGAATCLGLSLLSKETAVVFPVLLVLYEIVLGRTGASVRPTSRAGGVALHAVLGGTVVIFLVAAAFHARYAYLFRYGLGLRGFGENLVTQARAVAYSLSLFVWPARLNFDHDIAVSAALVAPGTLAALAVLAALVGAALAVVRRAPLFAFGVLWYFVHLLPTNSVFPRYDVLSERNLYLPALGLYLAVGAALAAVGRSAARWLGRRRPGNAGPAPTRRWLAPALVSTLVLCLAGATASRNRLYADPVLFWSDAVRKSPAKARPHTNLGQAWFEAGQVDKALSEFRTALSLDPYDPVARRNLLEAWKAKARLP